MPDRKKRVKSLVGVKDRDGHFRRTWTEADKLRTEADMEGDKTGNRTEVFLLS